MKTINDKNVTVLGTVGDADPIEYGGGYILREGDDEPRVEYFYGLDTDTADEEGYLSIYFATVEVDIFAWCDWVSLDEQEELAAEAELSIEEYRLQGRSSDAVVRARVLEDIAGRWGWHELDQYPARFTEAALRSRWGGEL